jgi:CysZ protein
MSKKHHFFLRSRSFYFGIRLPLDAAKLVLKNKALFLLSLLPVLLTVIVYYFAIRHLETSAQDFIRNTILSWGWDPQSWYTSVTLLLTRLILLLVAALTFAFSSSIVASPFNDFLAEKAERFTTPVLPPSPLQSWVQQARLIWIDLGKTIVAGTAAILALLLSWIPVVNIIAFAAAFLLITFQYISYPQTRRGVGIKEGTKFLWNYPFASLGFGASIGTLFAIPFLASFVLPLAVVGGTLLYGRAQDHPDQFKLK